MAHPEMSQPGLHPVKLVIDTDAKETLGEDVSDRDFPEYKFLLCHKKRRDLDLEEFRSDIKNHANKLKT